jgi:guanylate kinase
MKKTVKTPLIVVSAPSGAGKSSFCRKAVQDFSELTELISCTTRSQRPGETEGDPYFFLDKESFLKLRDKGHFIEWAEVYGNYYGTPKNQVDRARNLNLIAITDVDVQGASSFRKIYPDATYIFILPPSIDELRRRLEKRDQGKTTNLSLRIDAASKEIALASEFQFQIINDDFNRAYAEFKKIIEDLLNPR